MQHFSPNELYRKGMVCWQMAQPYVSFMKETDAIFCWGRPWRRWVLGVGCWVGGAGVVLPLLRCSGVLFCSGAGRSFFLPYVTFTHVCCTGKEAAR